MRKKLLLFFSGIALCMALSGCGRQTLQEVSDSVPSETEQSISDESASTPTEAEHGEIIFEEAPEGYVYDYQISLEPIPKEIADLGNPCQGTIHAFPSRIRIGLTEKMMEEDAELKAEVEKRIPEVEQCLKENIGGEFRVDGVDATDDFDWYFSCTEIDTGYQFIMLYWNNEYSARHDGITIPNKLYLEDYYDKIETDKVEQVYADIITDNFGECAYKIQVQVHDNGFFIVVIDIHEFTDRNIEKEEEQLKILEMWKELNAIDGESFYMIDLKYYPLEYENMLKEKCKEGTFEDMYIWHDSELLKNGELRARLFYDSVLEYGESNNLDYLLDLYESGKYNDKDIWSYWSVAE